MLSYAEISFCIFAFVYVLLRIEVFISVVVLFEVNSHHIEHVSDILSEDDNKLYVVF